MSNAIGAVGASPRVSPRIPPRIDPVAAANNTLAKVDTKNQGYIDKDELQAAVTKATSNQPAGAKADASNVDALFKKMDANGDGQIDKQELTDGFKKLSAELDNNHSQVNAGRAKLEGAHAGGPPHGGGAGGAGKAGGAQGADESGSSSSASKVYDPADTNQDGTVSAAELLAYQISTAEKQNSDTTATANSSANKDNTATQNSVQNSNSQMRDETSQLSVSAQLTRAYTASDQNAVQPGSTISVNA